MKRPHPTPVTSVTSAKQRVTCDTIARLNRSCSLKWFSHRCPHRAVYRPLRWHLNSNNAEALELHRCHLPHRHRLTRNERHLPFHQIRPATRFTTTHIIFVALDECIPATLRQLPRRTDALETMSAEIRPSCSWRRHANGQTAAFTRVNVTDPPAERVMPASP